MIKNMSEPETCKRHVGALETRPATPFETAALRGWVADPTVVLINVCQTCKKEI